MKNFERKRRNRPILKKWSRTLIVFTDSLRGRPAWTNCQIAVIGALPRHWECHGAKGNRSTDEICPLDDSPMIQPTEVVEDVVLDHRTNGEAVMFDSGFAINAAYYDELVRVGGVTWRQSKVSGVIRADDADGRAVGVVMPLTRPLRRD